MASTVLGKRSRSGSELSPCTRSKRVSRCVEVHSDENQGLETTDAVLSVTKIAAKEVADFYITTPSKPRSVTRPAKHGRAVATAQPASRGITSHFAVGKGVVDAPLKKASLATPPITPRHRDATKAKVPITPQNRVQIPGSVLTPRTPTTPSIVSKTNPYAQARQQFTGCSEQGLLVGREDEKKQVTDFITTHLDASTGGCLYVSGPPGTGKSAFVTSITQNEDILASTTATVINCMSVRNSAELTQIVAGELGLEAPANKKLDADDLKKHFTGPTSKACLLVLDEIDRLVELDLRLLYSLFEWSTLLKSKLILIGIANALDLTDRLLPRLKSRKIKPSLLPFMPYTAPQINDILTTKLRSLDDSSSDPTYVPFVHPAAILLCSKKVASQTGDLRKAFDIIKRALSLAESEARGSLSNSPSKTPLSENINLSSPPVATMTQTKFTSLSHLTSASAPRATIAHVAKVTSQIFSNGMSSRLNQLNIQQKAVLCTLASFEKRARSSLSSVLSTMTSFVPSTPSKIGRSEKKPDSPTTKQLYDSYAELCKRENLLHALSSVEFRDVLSGLETLSLIEFVDGGAKSGTLGLMTPSKTPSRKNKKMGFGQMGLGSVAEDRRVGGVVGFKELSDSLTGPGSEILREILDG